MRAGCHYDLIKGAMKLEYLSPVASPVPASSKDARGPFRFPSIQMSVAFVAGLAVIITGFALYFCIKRGYFRRNKKNNASRGEQGISTYVV